MSLTATEYQGHDRIVDFRLFHSRMIRTAGRGPSLSETTEKRQKQKSYPRRATKALRLTATECHGREEMIDCTPRTTKAHEARRRGEPKSFRAPDTPGRPPVSLWYDPPRRGRRGRNLFETGVRHGLSGAGTRFVKPVCCIQGTWIDRMDRINSARGCCTGR